MDLDGMNAIRIQPVEEFLFGGHQPNGELSLWRDRSVNARVLDILWLAFAVFENEANFWIGLHLWIDLGGTNLNLVLLSPGEKSRGKKQDKKSTNEHELKTPNEWWILQDDRGDRTDPGKNYFLMPKW